MVVGWHRPTRLHIDTQAITEKCPKGMSTFARRNCFICGCESERLWAWRRRIR